MREEYKTDNSTLLAHLKHRKMNVYLHRPFLNVDTATFLLYNLSGQIVGYQTYNPTKNKTRKNDPRDGKYYTYRTKPHIAIWGLESLYFVERTGCVFLTEGLFDAARLTWEGLPAFALLSNNPNKDTRNFLKLLPYNKVSVPDAGRSGKYFKRLGNKVEMLPEGVDDLGDAPDDFVLYLKRKYTK